MIDPARLDTMSENDQDGFPVLASYRYEAMLVAQDAIPPEAIASISPATQHKVHVTFFGRLIVIGFGSIGQGVLPLILRHVRGLTPERITIVTGDDVGRKEAQEYGIRFMKQPLTCENFCQVLEPMVGRGDFVLNVSVDVSSIALIKLCWERGALYLDTSIEPWRGGYTGQSLSKSHYSIYALREEVLALRKIKDKDPKPTAVVAHGANPGLVQHFVKQALINLTRDLKINAGNPKTREDWAALACSVGVKVIHIAERDTQMPDVPKLPGEFLNTWSVDSFANECGQPAELGWGSHERNFPRDGCKHGFGSGCAIYLMKPGALTRVRSWTPKAGHFHGFLITHDEAISIADFYTVEYGSQLLYRPTVHYAYDPCVSAVLSVHELAARNWHLQEQKRILMDDIVPGGFDELGVLLAGHKKNAYWYGSQLSVDDARKLAPHNNATSMQVTAACLSGMIWAIENPSRGLVEPDEMDFCRNLEICMPYLGEVFGEYTNWNPLQDRARLSPEEIDTSDPWQFKNVRVI